MSCPDEQTILDYLGGELEREAADNVFNHVEQCADCKAVVALASGDDPARETPAGSRVPTDDSDLGELPSASTIGRFVVLDRVGAGAMGVVYAAYDPQLDRRIALKVLRRVAGPAAQRGLADARLTREAQAMARLSHPNVVSVFDVQTIDGRLAVAMELIDGRTLRGWCAESPRPWQDIVRTFVAAGRGLAAAHDAGLVHRDFKPDNVLVAQDGRVLVTDFGLARSALTDGLPGSANTDDDDDDDDEPAWPSPPIELELTATGALLGTPAYMSPEQRAGGAVDARSDQYSFCVALCEALFGERPVLAPGADQTRLPRPTNSVRVPARVSAALERGLAVAPGQRHRSMHELLDALTLAPRARRWPAILGAAVATAILLGAALLGGFFGGSGPSCATAADQTVWTGPERAQRAQRFAALDAPWAADAWDRVSTSMDAYADALRAQQVDNCKATVVRKEQSATLRDRRAACLRTRAQEFAETSRLLAESDARSLREAPAWVAGLSSLAECERVDALLARPAEPDDPTARQRIADVRDALARVTALEHASRFDEARQTLAPALATARTTDYAPVEVSALIRQGRLSDQSSPGSGESALREAVVRALEQGDERGAVRAWVELVHTLSAGSGRVKEARHVLRLAEALHRRLGKPVGLARALLQERASLAKLDGDYAAARRDLEEVLSLDGLEPLSRLIVLGSLAEVMRSQGDLDDSLALASRAVDGQIELFGPSHPRVARALHQRGLAYCELGDYRAAIDDLERAVSIDEANAGPDSAEVADDLNALGTAQLAVGETARAERSLRRALAIRRAMLGDGHPLVADTLLELGGVMFTLNRPQEALDFNVDALESYRAALGEDHVEVGRALSNVAMLEKRLGRHRDALANFKRAETILVAALGPDHMSVGILWNNVGELLRAMEQPGAALPYYGRSLQVFEGALGPEHPLLSHPLTGQGLALLPRRPRAALAPLERAWQLRKDAAAHERAETGFALARALGRTGGDRERVRSLAEQSQRDYAAAGQGFDGERGRVADWLRKR